MIPASKKEEALSLLVKFLEKIMPAGKEASDFLADWPDKEKVFSTYLVIFMLDQVRSLQKIKSDEHINGGELHKTITHISSQIQQSYSFLNKFFPEEANNMLVEEAVSCITWNDAKTAHDIFQVIVDFSHSGEVGTKMQFIQKLIPSSLKESTTDFIAFLTAAAELGGLGKPAYLLGKLYMTGEATILEKNDEYAVKFLRIAAEQGEKLAMVALANLADLSKCPKALTLLMDAYGPTTFPHLGERAIQRIRDLLRLKIRGCLHLAQNGGGSI